MKKSAFLAVAALLTANACASSRPAETAVAPERPATTTSQLSAWVEQFVNWGRGPQKPAP